MLTLVGIFIIACAELIYDFKAMGESTNWSVFYFVSLYFALSLISFDVLLKEASKALRVPGVAFSLFYLLLVANEVQFINVPFDEYIYSVNDTKIRILTYGIICIILLSITNALWEERFSKK